MTLVQTSRMLRGYRRCAGCAYSLSGQPILREDDYDLYVVRCPECGRIAPMSEGQSMIRGRRLTVGLMAGGWILIVIAISIIAWTAMFGLTYGSAELAGGTLSSRVDVMFREQNPDLAFDEWWAVQDINDSLPDGRLAAINWNALWLWLPLAGTALVIGCFWGTLLHHRSLGRGLPIVAMLVWIGVLAAPMIIDAYVDQPRWSHEAAYLEVGIPVLAMSTAFGAAIFPIGLVLGPRASRGVIRMCLPESRQRWASGLMEGSAPA